MRVLRELFQNNRNWARRITASDPGFFEKLSRQQNPEFLWIGCSDSRVPANTIVDSPPGEVFVHRNIANLVVQTDLNCLSVIQYAVEVLKVKHIIVCGHYGCGGVRAAMDDTPLGLMDGWLNYIRRTHAEHRAEIDALATPPQRIDRLCELNVVRQVNSLASLETVRRAWDDGHELTLHGWIYNIADGLLQDLGDCITRADGLEGRSFEYGGSR